MHLMENTYQIIVEHAVDPIFVLDRSGRVLYANPAAEKAFGYSKQEFAGSLLHDLIHHSHPDGRPFPREECELFQVYSTGEIVEDRVATFIRKDGSVITMSASSTPVMIDGQRVGHVFYARNISKRIEAEKALAASEQRFRMLTDSMPQLVWTMTPEGEISYINARFRQYTGDDNAGGDYSPPLHPDDCKKTWEALQQALAGSTDYRVEHRARDTNGIYRWFLSHGIPCRDEEGKVIAWYGSSTDIDEIRRANDALLRSRETLQLAVEATKLGLWEYYTQSRELIWSEANRKLYGVPLDVPMNYRIFIERIHPDDRDRIDKAATRRMQPGAEGKFDAEFRIIRLDDGAERWLRVNGQSLKDPDDGSVRFVGTSLDITDSKLAEQRIREASQRDALTGLPNRALLFEYCDHLLAIAERTNSCGALLFIDLDRFKPINDEHGHDVGDQVLKQVAKRLLDCTRQEDIVGRLGGDEFVVAVPHSDTVHGPATVAQHIIERVSEPYQVGSLQLHLSPSIGIALYPKHGENLDTLIKCADVAMYEAKKAGRGRYKFYTPALENGVDQHGLIEKQLRHALEHDALILHYQPVMDMMSGEVSGVEALLRLPMPDGEALMPHQFLHVAEAAGLINAVGEWVAREACRQCQSWRAAGLPPMSVAINIAPQQVRQRSFVRYLADSIRRSGIDPSDLQIELKESTVLEDVHDTIATLEEIRALGIRVALDDFGVGYSSVGLLSSLPLDKLKIDRSFVNRLGKDARSQAITDIVLALGRSLNLEVVGEGIESEEEFDYLRDQGCNQAQGYYFSKPLSASEFEHWLRQSQAQSHSLH